MWLVDGKQYIRKSYKNETHHKESNELTQRLQS